MFFSFTVLSPQSAVHPGLLLKLQIMSTFQKSWFSANKCIFQIIQVIQQNHQNLESRPEQNCRHHFLLGYIPCTHRTKRHHAGRHVALQRFHMRVRKKKDEEFSRLFLSPKMPPFYICDHFHMRRKFQTAFFFVKWKQSFSGFTCSIVLCIADKTHLQVFISILTDFPDKNEMNI